MTGYDGLSSEEVMGLHVLLPGGRAEEKKPSGDLCGKMTQVFCFVPFFRFEVIQSLKNSITY